MSEKRPDPIDLPDLRGLPRAERATPPQAECL